MEIKKLNDTIYRQDALDALDCINGVEEVLKSLPSAGRPDPKPGKWIFAEDCYKCSECGIVYGWWADSLTSKYCPNCGARMEGIIK